MDARLVKLLLLRLRGGVRQRLKELKTPRGLLFLLVTLAVIALLMIQPAALPSNPFGSLFTRDSAQLREQASQYMPIGLLAGFLLTVLVSPSPGLYFNLAEINLLFGGPFTRRSVLLYKLGGYAFGVLLSSLLIALLLPASAFTPASTFLGSFLTLLFIQLLTVAAGLLGQVSMKCGFARVKCSHAVIAVIVLLAVTGGYPADVSGGLAVAFAQFQASFGGTLLLAPFHVYAHIFLAQSNYPELLAWAMLGLAMNLGLVAAVIRLDRHAYEPSTAASLELHQRWDRARRGGLPWGAQPRIVRSSRSPAMLGGIGPIAWRQMLSAIRVSRNALLTFLAIAIVAGPLLVIASSDISIWSLAAGVFVAAVFVLPRTLVFDFRSDLQTLQNFKALPLPAWKISLGQLAAPVLLTSLIEGVLLISTAIFTENQTRGFLTGIGLFLLPFNMLLYEAENLFFLLFPAPLVPVGRADFDFMGRTLVGYAVTATVLIGSCLLAAGAGYWVLTVTGLPWPVFVAAAWFSLTLIAMMLLPLLSWAFNRFDVSRG
jgi:hypothetical protein